MFLIMLFAQNVLSMTMDEAVSYALQNNPEIQALRLEEEIAKGQIEKARLLFINNPTVEGEVSTKEKPIEEGSGKYKNYGFKLSQEFEIAGQKGLRIAVAEKGLSRVSLEIKNKERILTNEVKNTAASAIALKQKTELAKEVVLLKNDLLDFISIRFQAGDVSGIEVNLAEIELSKTKRELILTEKEYKEAVLALQGLLGRKPDNTFLIDGELPREIPSSPDEKDLLILALQRPDVKAAIVEKEESEAAFALTKKELIPDITLSGFYDRDTSGISVSIPLPLFDKKQTEIKEAMVRTEQTKIKHIGLEGLVDKEVEEAYINFSIAIEELSLFKKEVLNRVMENMSLMELAFKEGKIGFFEVRLAQKDIIEIQFAYLEAQLRMQLAINAIEFVTGGSLR
jgi:cobalt-zinc-cadmium efflux system outer membrane protein